MGIADALPEYHHRERHSIHVAATPAEALAAAKAVTLADVPLLRALFRLRGLGTPPRGTLWAGMGKNGFRLEGEDTIVLVGRPWVVTGGRRPDVEAFAAFDEPCYAKMGLDLTAVPEGHGARLATETRVFLTDRSAQRRFRVYWLLIRPFSGLTRRSWLKAAKRRAEK
jgi:hypothetical protein